MSAFYPGVRPSNLVPGDPGTLRGLAGSLEAFAQGFSGASSELRAIDSGRWRGTAGNAFRNVLVQQPGRYTTAADSFGSAAGALRGYAGTLESAQYDASLAIAAYENAQQETAAWQVQRQSAAAHHTTVSSVDPGERGRERANAILQAAQADARAGAASLRGALEAAGSSAPRRPSLAGELVHGADQVTREFVRVEGAILKGMAKGAVWGVEHAGELAVAVGKLEVNVTRAAIQIAINPRGWSRTIPRLTGQFMVGIGAGVVGMVTGVVDVGRALWAVSPERALIDPKGWATSVDDAFTTTGKIGSYAIEHPAAFAKVFGSSLVNAKEWKDDPAKAIGELVPAVVLGVVTAGAGSAADGLGVAAEGFEYLSADAMVAGDAAQGAELSAEGAEVAETAGQAAEVVQVIGSVGDVDNIDGVAHAAQGAAGLKDVKVSSSHELDGEAAGEVGEHLVEPAVVDELLLP